MTTISMHIPLTATLAVDDELFSRLGGTVLRCSVVGDDGTVDLTAEGTDEAVAYCFAQLRLSPSAR